MGRMKNERKPSKGGWAIVVAMVVIVGLPTVYVLSIGPALWLCDHGYVRGRTVDAVYRPIYIADEEFPAVGSVLHPYAAWWRK